MLSAKSVENDDFRPVATRDAHGRDPRAIRRPPRIRPLNVQGARRNRHDALPIGGHAHDARRSGCLLNGDYRSIATGVRGGESRAVREPDLLGATLYVEIVAQAV